MLQSKLIVSYLLPRDKVPERLGFDVWKSFFVGNETWMDNGLFPRVTLCDFEVSVDDFQT